jgi:hypothetical protein
VTETKRDLFHDVPTTIRCEQCGDGDPRRLFIEQAFLEMEAEGRIVAHGEQRPCLKCGKLHEVYVSSKIFTRH